MHETCVWWHEWPIMASKKINDYKYIINQWITNLHKSLTCSVRCGVFRLHKNVCCLIKCLISFIIMCSINIIYSFTLDKPELYDYLNNLLLILINNQNMSSEHYHSDHIVRDMWRFQYFGLPIQQTVVHYGSE